MIAGLARFVGLTDASPRSGANEILTAFQPKSVISLFAHPINVMPIPSVAKTAPAF